MSAVERALEEALLTALSNDDAVLAHLGNPMRAVSGDGARPAYPYFEVSRHSSRPADASGVVAGEHRIDLAVVSRNDAGKGGLAAAGAVRAAIAGASLAMEGWRCVLLVPVFMDQLRQGSGVWRTVLRIKAVVEAD